MPGCFFISSACSFSAFIEPSTISCICRPEFFTTNFTVSPCLTSSAAGVKRIVSAMSTLMVRATFRGSPVRPKSVSTIGCVFRALLCPSPCETATLGLRSSASASTSTP